MSEKDSKGKSPKSDLSENGSENDRAEQKGEPVEGLPLDSLPVLPLRDVVVYPHMVIPLFVGREKSIEALDAAMSTDKRIMLAAQTSA